MTEQIAPTEPATPSQEPATPEVAPPEGATSSNGAVPEANGHGAVPAASDWRTSLEGADPEELRRHPKVAGVVGQMVDAAMRNWQRTQAEEHSRVATETARQELRTLARSDPEAFAERFLTDDQRDIALGQLQTMRQQTEAAMAQRVGHAYATIPGWDHLTVDDHATLAKAIQGVPDDEVIARYNAVALDLLTKHRVEDAANERFERFKKSELAKEREAIRAEVAAELLKKEPKPDMTRATKAPALDISRMTDEDFEKWYTQQGPGASLGLPTRSGG